MAKVRNQKFVTPHFRVSYPALFEPDAPEGQEKKYGVCMLFPKDTDISALKEAAKKAAINRWGPDMSDWPKPLRSPFRDGDKDKPDSPEYAGMVFVNARNKRRPGLVDGKKKPILDRDEMYAGCWARAELVAFAYDKAGNRGVAFALNHVQKVGDDDAFDGRGKAEDAFDAIEGADDVTSSEVAVDDLFDEGTASPSDDDSLFD